MNMAETAEEADLQLIRSLVKFHDDFPIQGIKFLDIFPIFQDPHATEFMFSRIQIHLQSKFCKGIDCIVGLDSRGFLFAPILAVRLGCAFVPVRKPGKLPGKCHLVQYAKEYGKDGFEIQEGAIKPGTRVVIVDDLLATGGSLKATGKLINDCGGIILEYLTVLELVSLNGRHALGAEKVFSLLKYD